MQLFVISPVLILDSKQRLTRHPSSLDCPTMSLKSKTHLIPWFIAFILFVTQATGQASSVRNQMADLSQRFVELEQQYNLMKLQVDNLVAENNRLKQDIAQMKKGSSTEQVEALIKARLDAQKRETDQLVKDQYERVLQMIAARLDGVSVARTSATITPTTTQTSPTATSPSPTGDFPRNGVVYTVQSGDTLSKIATQHGSTVRFIQDANNITNPNTVQVGQKLFIPIEKR
jgi:LysM repeat protein